MTEPTDGAPLDEAGPDEQSPGSSDTRPAFRHAPPKHGVIGPFGARQLALGLAVVVVAVVLLLAVTAPLGSTDAIGVRNPQATPFLIGPAPAQGLKPGDRAPEFTITKPDGTTAPLTDLEGNAVSLTALRGTGVWVNFWASWCPPCQQETPVLRDTYATYKDQGLEVIGISVQETNEADVAAYAAKYGLGYTIAADLTGDILHLYRVNALPTSFFIGPDGIIRDVVLAPLDDEGAAAEVQAILPNAAPSASPIPSALNQTGS
ncbi:MAG TPA: TlpA disulfide reductase family protein [Candidatus Binatia bacterium]|nr:TlpA disulfide reductase family protein [Candidatus Binatia bacterium]